MFTSSRNVKLLSNGNAVVLTFFSTARFSATLASEHMIDLINY